MNHADKQDTVPEPVRVYGLKHCDSCRKLRAWLAHRQLEHVFIDYREHPMDAATLLGWQAALGGWAALINKRSTAWRALDATQRAATTDAAWLALIAAHPTLIKRPLVLTPRGIVLGYNESRLDAAFS